jgi:hypothetical protein
VLSVVPTPIGNRQDITLRAVEVLKAADLIAAEDTRHSGLLLQHLGIKKPYLSLHGLGGTLIASRSEVVHPGFNAFYFDVSGISEGIYFVRLQDKRNGKAEVMKLSVVRGGGGRPRN